MKSETAFNKCVNCKTILEAGWTRCPRCLTPTSEGDLVCPNPDCGRPIEKDWKECPACHRTLSGFLTPKKRVRDSAFEDEPIRAFISEDLQQPGSIFQISTAELPLNDGDTLGDRGRYRIIRSLGEGGSAAVYQAEDTILKETIALKVVQTSSDNAERIAQKIFHEYQLHTKIADIRYVIRTQDPRPCEFKELSLVLLPMELADGGTFRGWLNQNSDVQKRRKQGIDYFKQVCMGIKAIHDAGIIHLDIKPDNILIVEGKAKIADFGIGRFLASRYRNNPEQLLRQGVGTPEYMSPEQFYVARQKNVGLASDIYSLGIVLFELIDGSPPFDGTAFELRQKHLQMQIPQMTGNHTHWQRVVQRCLEKEPKNRYPDVDSFIRDIDYIMQDLYSCIDVSCPNCGHYNQNEEARICEKCHHDLSLRFKECPVCLFRNRKDVKTCGHCGFDVGLYNLSLARWDRIQRLKDEDLAEALDVLGIILKEGIDILDAGSREQQANYHRQALDLTRQLHKKQEKVAALIASAEKAYASHYLEQALEHWQQVLESVPRHRRSAEQVHHLKAVIHEYADNLKRSRFLMDEGTFEDAEKCLIRCQEIKPSNKEVKKELSACRKRADDFEKAQQQADDSVESKRLNAAYAAAVAGLSASPKCERLSDLKNNISQQINTVKQCVVKLKKAYEEGDIEAADLQLHEIEAIQSDDESAQQLREHIAHRKTKYDQCLRAAQKAFEKHKLSDASQQATQALDCVPQSSAMKNLLQQIEHEQQKASKLIDQAVSGLPSGDFEKLRLRVQQSLAIWSDQSRAAETNQQITKIETQYRHLLTDAKSLIEQQQLNRAYERLEAAATLCPQSQEVRSLIKDVTEKRNLADMMIEKALSYNQAADFDNAYILIEQARSEWADGPRIYRASQTIKENHETYTACMAKAETLLSECKLDQVTDPVRSAQKICPQSPAPIRLLDKIKDQKALAHSRVQKAIDILLSADFETADELLAQAQKLWYQMPSLREAFALAEKMRSQYKELYDKTTEACKAGRLDLAMVYAVQLIKVCPKAIQALALQEQLQHRQKQTHLLLQQTSNYLAKADFETVDKMLKDVEEIWAAIPELKETVNHVGRIKKEYDMAMQHAKKSLSLHKLDGADKNVQIALSVCPQSSAAQAVLKDIQGEKVEVQLSRIHKMIVSAEFSQAAELIEWVRQSSPDHEQIAKYQSSLDSIQQGYETCMKQAMASATLGHYEEALTRLSEAHQSCPQSKYPMLYATRIRHTMKRKEIVQFFMNKALVWFGIVVGVTEVSGLLLIGDRTFGLLTLFMVLIATVLNMVFKTNLYRTVKQFRSVTNHVEIGCLIFGCIGLLCGIFFVVFPGNGGGIYLPFALILYVFSLAMPALLNRIPHFLKRRMKSKVLMGSGIAVAVMVTAIWIVYYIHRPHQNSRVDPIDEVEVAMDIPLAEESEPVEPVAAAPPPRKSFCKK